MTRQSEKEIKINASNDQLRYPSIIELEERTP